MALVLFLEHRKMGQKAKKCFEGAEEGKIEIIIPAMVIAEIGYLSQKNKIKISIKDIEALTKRYPNYQIADLNLPIIKESFFINDIPELHDRLIAGTAQHFNVKLITDDPIIIDSKAVDTIWK